MDAAQLEFDRRLDALVRMPWTVRVEKCDDGYLVARVDELPSVVATGDTEKQLEDDFWAALRATLSAYLEFGDEVPLPESVRPTVPILSIEDRGVVRIETLQGTWGSGGAAEKSPEYTHA